jgi:acetylornithine deacetylase/succinyl-diaminopimelate desuccinylase family protein
MKDKIQKSLDELSEEIVGFAQELIEIPTENPPGRSYKDCIQLIERKLNQFGLDTQIIEVETSSNTPYPRYCLISSFGSDGKTVYFHGHYDVVPGDHTGQFTPHVRDGKLFGRGSSDMKGGLASMIYAVRILQLCDAKLNGRVCLVIVPDEETGGKHGAGYLFERSLLKRDDGVAMFMPEPTDGAIWNACRGAISLRVRTKGKPVHVVLQHKGVNAFEKMLQAANALLRLKSQVEQRRTSFDLDPEMSKRSILMLGGLCAGGTNFNTVPGECSFTVERRINPEENLQEEKKALDEVFENLREQGVDTDIEVLQQGESAKTPSDHSTAQVLASSVEAITGTPPAFRMCPGLLETRFYAKQNIPAFGYGPGFLSVSHGPEEFVSLKNIYDCTAVYALTALGLLQSEHMKDKS